MAHRFRFLSTPRLHLRFFIFVLSAVLPAAWADEANLDLLAQSGGVCRVLQVQEDYAYVREGGRLKVFNVSDATHARQVSQAPLDGSVADMVLAADKAYVTVHVDSENAFLQVLDIGNPGAPTLEGSCEVGRFGGAVVVADSIAYVATSYDGLWIIDVSDPAAPVILSSYDERLVLGDQLEPWETTDVDTYRDLKFYLEVHPDKNKGTGSDCI